MSQQRLAAANQALAQNQAQLASGIGGLATGFAMGQFGDVGGIFGQDVNNFGLPNQFQNMLFNLRGRASSGGGGVIKTDYKIG